METPPYDPAMLIKLARMKMPYGKYAGRRIIDLPEHYLVWYNQKGFPKGELGKLMALAYEIELNGLKKLLKPLE